MDQRCCLLLCQSPPKALGGVQHLTLLLSLAVRMESLLRTLSNTSQNVEIKGFNSAGSSRQSPRFPRQARSATAGTFQLRGSSTRAFCVNCETGPASTTTS